MYAEAEAMTTPWKWAHIEVPTFLNLSKIFVYNVKKQLIECDPGNLFLKTCLAFKIYHSL